MKFVRYGLPPILWAGVLFWLSSQSSLPSISDAPGFDKLEHVGAYAVLGALVSRAFLGYGTQARRALFFGTVLGALYGVSDEFHQSFVPSRSADPFDAAADALGAAAGSAASALIRRKLS